MKKLTNEQIEKTEKFIQDLQETLEGDVPMYMGIITELFQGSVAIFGRQIKGDINKLDYIENLMDSVKANIKADVFGA